MLPGYTERERAPVEALKAQPDKEQAHKFGDLVPDDIDRRLRRG